jgi:hypothetical protein|tara:strand:+ start:440 stop:649 length:210 start_codon:yes stop_codon:yes gene_type:complete
MLDFKYAVFLSTFFVFLLEGLFHYNVGKSGLRSLCLPNKYDMCKIVLILIFFSMLNAYISKYLFDYEKK